MLLQVFCWRTAVRKNWRIWIVPAPRLIIGPQAPSRYHSPRKNAICYAQLVEVYRRYDRSRARAIDVFDEGRPAESRQLLAEMTLLYHEAYRLCEQYIAANERAVADAMVRSDRRVQVVMWSVGVFSILSVLLACVLLWLFFRGVVLPLRSLLTEVHRQIPASAQLGASGEEVNVVGFYLRRVLLDVKDAKTALEKTRAELLLSERLASVGKLAASVAHEIRNPLTAMKMWLFSARESLGHDAQENDVLQKIESEVHRLENIIHHFLEFSRPPELRMRSVELERVVQDALELTRPLLAERAVRVVYPPPADRIVLSADRDQLIQVFSNLFYNAVQAMPQRGTLTIEVAVIPPANKPNGNVDIRVRDTGSGISPENEARLFEPFFSTKPEGTGLGLCIAASIVAHHQGRLFLESTGDIGSVFVVQLPLGKQVI